MSVEISVAGGNSTNAWDGLWWAVVTVSTAGFGDLYPVTVEGRLIAMVMLVTGIGLFGTFTALVASWFMGGGEEEDRRVRELVEEVRELRAMLSYGGPSRFGVDSGRLTDSAATTRHDPHEGTDA